MNFPKKTAASFLLLITCVILITSCKPTSYGTFKVTQSKAVKGDFIVLPYLTYKNGVLSVNPDKSFHIPLVLYKAFEKRIPDLCYKFNDFSTGMSQEDCEELYDLYFASQNANIISDEKDKSEYYSIITDLNTKIDAKNAEAIAIKNEMDEFISMFEEVVELYLETLTELYSYVNKFSTNYESHQDVFDISTDNLDLASKMMSYWFPSSSFIDDFSKKTGPDVANPWIPDWEELITLYEEFIDEFTHELLIIDRYDYEALNGLSNDAYDILEDIKNAYYELPYINEYENKYDSLTNSYKELSNRLDDYIDDCWDSYYDYYWW